MKKLIKFLTTFFCICSVFAINANAETNVKMDNLLTKSNHHISALKLEKGFTKKNNNDFEMLETGALNGFAYTLANGETYGYNLDTYFKPASTEKVITALAAMLYLGPNFQFETSLNLEKKAIQNKKIISRNGVLESNVEIVFRGDPYLTRQHLVELLNVLKTSGIKKIKGDIILNHGYFAGHDYASGWSWDDLSKCFTAPASAIVINGNCTYIKLIGRQLNTKPIVEIPKGIPIEVYADDVEVVTANEYYGGCELEMHRDSKNIYHLSGCIPVQTGKQKPLGLSLAIQDPEQWGIDNMKKVIEALELELTGNIITARKTPDIYAQYASYHSVPLKKMLNKCLKKSVNIIADTIVKTIGTKYNKRPANYHTASLAIRSILKKKGIDIGNATIIDGSGLSAHNYITPKQMLNVLNYILEHDKELNLIELFPVAGMSGTLSGRSSVMKPPLVKNVTAKTGTLETVANLAGFMTTQSGAKVPFVYFVNNISYDDKTKRQLQTRRISKPHYKHEKATLENIYNEIPYYKD